MESKLINALLGKAILFIALILPSILASAQTFRFEHLTSKDGISQSEIYAFLEDSRGFMWIGTIDGLNRYDGYNINIFNTDRNDPHSLSNNTIRSLKEDNQGRIWIGTDDGLNFYDSETELIYQVKINSSAGSFSVWSIFIQDEYLLVGTNKGLWGASISDKDIAVIESKFHKIREFSKNPDIEPFIRSIVKCKHGGLWIQTSNNISRVAFNEFSDEIVIIEDLTINYIKSHNVAVEDSMGNLWIASFNDGLVRYNPITREEVMFTGRESGGISQSNNCSALTIDNYGNLWVGTLDKGIYFARAESLNKDDLDLTSFQNVPSNLSSLNSNLIYSLYLSKHNILWVGTIGSGISIYDPNQKKFNHYKFSSSCDEEPKSNFIRSVYASDQNTIWLGTHNNGLYILNRENRSFRKLGFGSLSIFHLANFVGDKNFICSGEGLYLVELIKNSYRVLSDNTDFCRDPVFNIVQSKEGIFWYASLNGVGRVRVENDEIVVDSFYSTDTKLSISASNCRVLYYDKKFNELLVGTEGGGLNILKLDENHYPKKIEAYKKNASHGSISNNYVRSIIKDSKENIWIGTYEGLNLMIRDSISSNLSFKTYTLHDGLPNNMIQLLVEDDNHNLWIGTNGGLSKFNPDENEFVNFTINDGIQSKEFSEHAVYKKADGEVIVGGINGINTFYPDQIKVSNIKPQITLTGFYFFNEKVKPLQKVGRRAPLERSIVLTDTIILPPVMKNIGFEFSSMIYPNAEKVKYAYMLEGFEDDWHITGSANRIINYTNLKYGKYKFLVKATNSDGIWDSPKEVYIHIQTPFKFTVFAYIIYILIISLTFTYFSLRYTTKKKLVLLREHADRIHKLDEMRTRFFVNISHDLRTPLTLITGPLNNLLLEKNLDGKVMDNLQLIKRNVKRLSYLVEQLLDIRKSESGTLAPRLQSEDLVSFTRNEVAHFTYALKKKGLKLKIKTSDDKILARFDPGMISKVYFNIISNSIKYTEKGRIEISIKRINKDSNEILRDSSFSSYVKVEISDTGKGISGSKKEKIFERFYQDQSQSEYGYGIGLSHTKELIDAHQGFVEVESEEGSGTTIRFFLPDKDIVVDIEKTSSGISSTEDLYIDSDRDIEVYTTSLNKSAKTILIVEDNDDMRLFITNEFKSEFNVLQAPDGVEGLKIAKSMVPDIIISDIMMPNMDGIEFCQNIKSNIKTCHIPVILLTAKIDADTKYKGIETGADDFIPKPFEIEYLALRVKNLLHSREELRKLFQKSYSIEPSAVAVTSLDEKFLSSLKKAIEEGISDPDFSISSLETELGMSHANFYRKIKGLTGESGQELLQNMRMKRAHQIISEKKGMRIAEVAYMVGFANPKYFSKCFKDKFGYIPSEIKHDDE